MNKKLVITLLIGLGLTAATTGYVLLDGDNQPKDGEPTGNETAGAVQLNNRVLRYAPGAPQLTYLRIEAALAQPVPLTEPLNGRVAYDENVTARISPAIEGRITRIMSELGDRVNQGQPLLWLNSPDYAQASADLHKAESDSRQKQLAFERAKTLFDGGVLARKDYETAENDLHQARAELERARARLKNLDPLGIGKDGDFPLRAPLAGTVTERKASPGTEARPDAADPLFVVSDLSRLWVLAEVAERDLGKVRQGQPVAIEVDALPGQSVAGTISDIGDVIDPDTRRVIVRCAVSNPKRQLKPEMFARISPLAEGQALPRVPNGALVTQGVKTFVFVETAPGTLEKREVTLAFRGNEQSYIGAGIKAGDRVVTSGALLLNAELGG